MRIAFTRLEKCSPIHIDIDMIISIGDCDGIDLSPILDAAKSNRQYVSRSGQEIEIFVMKCCWFLREPCGKSYFPRHDVRSHSIFANIYCSLFCEKNINKHSVSVVVTRIDLCRGIR